MLLLQLDSTRLRQPETSGLHRRPGPSRVGVVRRKGEPRDAGRGVMDRRALAADAICPSWQHRTAGQSRAQKLATSLNGMLVNASLARSELTSRPTSSRSTVSPDASDTA